MAIYLAAYGIPGYGPDPGQSEPYEAWTMPHLADILRELLTESADIEMDSARMYAESGDYETAWKTFERTEDMLNVAACLDNERQHAPLYEGKPELWADTIRRTVAECFPYDVSPQTRIYVWEAEPTYELSCGCHAGNVVTAGHRFSCELYQPAGS